METERENSSHVYGEITHSKTRIDNQWLNYLLHLCVLYEINIKIYSMLNSIICLHSIKTRRSQFIYIFLS